MIKVITVVQHVYSVLKTPRAEAKSSCMAYKPLPATAQPTTPLSGEGILATTPIQTIFPAPFPQFRHPAGFF